MFLYFLIALGVIALTLLVLSIIRNTREQKKKELEDKLKRDKYYR